MKLVRLGAAVLLASGVSVSGQTPIRVEVTGQATTQHAASTPISVTISNTITGTVQVKIYDVNTIGAGAPSNNIGAVTISGTVGTSGTPLLEVLVADGDTSFPSTPPELMTVGAIDFAGLSFSSTALRDISRVAVAVAGDITGSIEAGAIRRIQALGRVVSGPTYVAGKITGNITATSADFSAVCGNAGFESFRAIGVIWAGDEISGTISATSDDESNPGGLTWLLIGHESNTTPVGLLGDVRIDYGSIEKVHTAGPIGSSTVMPKIWAGRSIQEVRVLQAADLGSASPVASGSAKVKADVQTGLNPDSTHEQSIHGALHLLMTDGDLQGAITIANLAPGNASLASGARGIFVGGAITAPIAIRYNLQNSDIIAASIDAPITIGCRAKGSIVASDPNGQIVSVEIGYANEGLDEEDEGYDPVAAAYAAHWGRLFTGTKCVPVSPWFTVPYDEYTRADWTADVVHCGPYNFDGGAIDSVIRAASIGTLRIHEMGVFDPAGPKPYLPRIESPMIDSLEVEILRAGVVWSGELQVDYIDDEWVVANNPEDDYASIGAIRVGWIGPAGDLWVDGTTRVQIDGDMLGQVHVPTLTDTIWIGGRLGLWCHYPGCSCPGNCAPLGNFDEESPRDTTWEGEEIAARGEIVIREVGGLQGQIIINGNNDGGTWDGAVIVGDELGYGNRIVITPDDGDAEFDPDFQAPHYLSPSGPLGVPALFAFLNAWLVALPDEAC
ncbi:MAG: hypothetical protein KF699_07935 [Phycisphaeraceae bacterium]|nr:hypothetical protein [Phycisphaeraceae bacterium]